MSSRLDQVLDLWDVRDPADLLRRMGSEMPFRPGELRVATVENASTDCRLLGQVRAASAPVAVRAGDPYADHARRRAVLTKALRALPYTEHAPGRPPWTTVVLVSTRYGRVVPGRQEHAWMEALHFCNEVAVRGMFKGDPVLLTQHGWLVLGSEAAGAEPRLAAERPRPVSAARRTSSSRAGSARRSP